MIRKKIISIALLAAMVLSIVPVGSIYAEAAETPKLKEIRYTVEDEETQVVEKFNEDQNYYEVTLPDTTSYTAEMTVTAIDDKDIEGKTIKFTLKDGIKKVTCSLSIKDERGYTITEKYTVLFSKKRSTSSEAGLKTLSYTLDGANETLVPKFSSNTETYSVTLPKDTSLTATMRLIGVAIDSEAYFFPVTSYLRGGSGTARIAVMAPDGVTKKSYSVSFALEVDKKDVPEAATKLKEIRYVVGDGVTQKVGAFNEDKNYYEVTLPESTSYTEKVFVTAIDDKGGSGRTGTVTLKDGFGKVTCILSVKNERGIASSEKYTVLFNIKRSTSAENRLESLSYTIDGNKQTAVPRFNINTKSYSIILPKDTDKIATMRLVGVTADKAAYTSEAATPLINGKATARITVTAPNGLVKTTYSVKFEVEVFNDEETWAKVTKMISDAAAGETIEVSFYEKAILPREILVYLRDRNVNLKINWGASIWTINGSTIGEVPDRPAGYDLKTTGKTDKLLVAMSDEKDLYQLKTGYAKTYPFLAQVEIEAGELYTSDLLYVYWYEAKKKSLSYISSGYVDQDGFISFPIREGGTYVLATEKIASQARIVFDDVECHWGLEAIQHSYENNYFGGISLTKFGPDVAVSRAMLVTLLGRKEGVNTQNYLTGAAFTDVKNGNYYTPYIEWAKENGIVKGNGSNNFNPNARVTREEAAVIINNYADFANCDPSENVPDEKFADHSSISPWAVSSVMRLKNTKIISGKLNNNFEPKGYITRAEFATIIKNFDLAE